MMNDKKKIDGRRGNRQCYFGTCPSCGNEIHFNSEILEFIYFTCSKCASNFKRREFRFVPVNYSDDYIYQKRVKEKKELGKAITLTRKMRET